MTSNTTPMGYTASALTRGTTGFNAFDGNPTTYWAWTLTGTPWVQLQLPTPQLISNFVIAKRNASTGASNWYIQGSNDGTTFTNLY